MSAEMKQKINDLDLPLKSSHSKRKAHLKLEKLNKDPYSSTSYDNNWAANSTKYSKVSFRDSISKIYNANIAESLFRSSLPGSSER